MLGERIDTAAAEPVTSTDHGKLYSLKDTKALLRFVVVDENCIIISEGDDMNAELNTLDYHGYLKDLTTLSLVLN